MAKRVVTSKTTTYVASKNNKDKDVSSIWLTEDDFEKRPKTDYTYSRSATYSNKYISGEIISPNLSRRRLYTGEIIRDNQASSELRPESPVLSHVRSYGSRRTNLSTGHSNNLSQNLDTQMLTRSGRKSASGSSTTVTSTSTTTERNSNNNHRESVFSSDEEFVSSSFTMRGKKRGGGRGRAASGSRSRSRGRTSASRSARTEAEADSNLLIGKSAATSKSYHLSSGLDDSMTETAILTERSSTVINAVSMGTVIATKLTGYLMPLALLMGGVCSLHSWGYVDVGPCAPLTGVYQVKVDAGVDTPGISVKIKELLNGLYIWREQQHSKLPVVDSGSTSAPDWSGVIDARMDELKSTLILQSNKMASEQKQQKSEFETAMLAIRRDVDDMKLGLKALDAVSSELQALKLKVSLHSERLASREEYKDSIARLQAEITQLKMKLGDVNVESDGGRDSGILFYLYNEINNLKTSLNDAKTKEVPLPCPQSNCVCESELGPRLTALHEQLLKEMNGGTTVILGTDNSTNFSEQLVRKMIHDELDIFAADQTGMVDFAMQSMGGQVISSRCSQTYSEFSPLLRFFGLPLYYMERDPSVVIQPGVIPGEGWCFHGSAGSLVISMADDIKFNSFSLEHISAKQSASGEILSAPRDIEVYGLTSEGDTTGRKIGRWRYEKAGPRIQFFPVHDSSISPYRIVELRVLSNWGQPEHTCLYRFRVHGKLASS